MTTAPYTREHEASALGRLAAALDQIHPDADAAAAAYAAYAAAPAARSAMGRRCADAVRALHPEPPAWIVAAMEGGVA